MKIPEATSGSSANADFGSCVLAIDYSTLTLSQTDQIINTEEADDVDEAFTMLQDN